MSELHKTEAVTSDDKFKGLNATEYKMATYSLKKLVLVYSIPTIIGMMTSALYNIVDRYFVAQMPGVGQAALAGLGLCVPITNIMFGCAQLVGIGGAACISIRIGKKDREAAEQILGNVLSIMLILIAALTVIGLVFCRQILMAVGADEETLPFALPYIRIIICGCVFWLASFAMNHQIRATGHPRRFASTQLLGGISNIVLDYVFIFIFDMGIEGAAIATVISQALSAVWVFSYYFTKDAPLRIRLRYLRPRLDTAAAIFSIGLSPFLMQVANSFLAVVINLSLRHYGNIEFGSGTIAISAMTVINSISTIFIMPIIGINQGAQPIVGFNYGFGDYSRVKDAYKWSVIYCVSLCCAGFAVIQLFAPSMVKFFNPDPMLIDIGANGMRIFLFMLPLIGFQLPSANFFQAIGRAVISIFLSLLRQVILLIPAYLILPLFFGFKGIWFAGLFADFTAAVITVFFIISEFKKLRVRMGVQHTSVI